MKRSSRDPGYTLLEVLVALFIVSLLIGTATGMWAAMARQHLRVLDEQALLHAYQYVLARLEPVLEGDPVLIVEPSSPEDPDTTGDRFEDVMAPDEHVAHRSETEFEAARHAEFRLEAYLDALRADFEKAEAEASGPRRRIRLDLQIGAGGVSSAYDGHYWRYAFPVTGSLAFVDSSPAGRPNAWRLDRPAVLFQIWTTVLVARESDAEGVRRTDAFTER
ncbi:MAG: type II secretion system protein [Hydrogenibacillus sp.]|nr:type II secretion system protein [Hydrogenibacillus sp.]